MEDYVLEINHVAYSLLNRNYQSEFLFSFSDEKM